MQRKRLPIPFRRMWAALLATALCLPAASASEHERIEAAPGVYLQSVDGLPSERLVSGPEAHPPVTRASRIVGGTETTITQCPWQTAIAFRPSVASGNSFQRQFCGGTLVTPIFVVTAAHCFYRNGGFTPPDQYSVITGRTNLSSSAGQEIDFDTYFVPVDALGNPLFDPNGFEFDAVIVRLQAPSVSPTIQIAGPDERATWAAGQPAFLTGWGDTAEGAGAFPDALRVGRVAIADDLACADSYAAVGTTVRPDTMLCAGRVGGGVDTCQGDSGGPMVVPVSGGGFRLVGDTSFGIGCARPGFPGVYGRLADDPLRSIIGGFILSQTGIDVIGSGATPIPLTRITEGPKRITIKRKARFVFVASEPGSTFRCRLDQRRERPCTSPFLIRVRPGKHRFRIIPVSPLGERGLPAMRTWTVRGR
ncbi:MAG: serine protease [Beggiatoa sp.]|nr:serine protease [Beggiatoa sp.]